MKAEPIYYNDRQQESMAIGANTEIIIAPRGFGKSTGIDCPRLIRNVHAMPTSVGALLSPTYKKLLTNTLPPVFAGLKKLGYHRDVHYFVGKKAPKRMGFAEPHTMPENWDNTIHFYDGTIAQMLSFDLNMSANSMNLDWVMGFEAKYLKYEKVQSEVIPANRGNLNLFQDCPWHHSYLFTTDMPTTSEGKWLFEYEKMMDTELIDVIKLTYSQLYDLKSKPDTIYYNRERARLKKELDQMRSVAVYYAEYKATDNYFLLGDKFYKDMERSLPPLLFQTSILNKRLKKIENGFYSSLNEKIHCYVANNNSVLSYLDYDLEKAKSLDCKTDSDIDLEQPIAFGMDYNAAINNIVCGQKVGNEARILKSFFVKTPLLISDLVFNFCAYYRQLPLHEVIYYYDHTAVAKSASSNESFAEIVIRTFESLGWSITPVYMGQTDKHDTRYLYINKALRGDREYLFPTFNRDNNDYLLLAMDLTGVKQGRNGFEKDKSPEKLADSVELPDENKTHVTDAFDTLYRGLNWFPYSDISSGPSGSNFG